MDFVAIKAGIEDGSINETNLNARLGGLEGFKLALLRFLLSTVP